MSKSSSNSVAARYAQHCNEKYVEELKAFSSNIPGPEPTAKIAIITCMDARLGKSFQWKYSWLLLDISKQIHSACLV